MGEHAAQILPSPSQWQQKGKDISSLILALTIALRTLVRGNYQPHLPYTQLQLFWWLPTGQATHS